MQIKSFKKQGIYNVHLQSYSESGGFLEDNNICDMWHVTLLGIGKKQVDNTGYKKSLPDEGI